MCVWIEHHVALVLNDFSQQNKCLQTKCGGSKVAAISQRNLIVREKINEAFRQKLAEFRKVNDSEQLDSICMKKSFQALCCPILLLAGRDDGMMCRL